MEKNSGKKGGFLYELGVKQMVDDWMILHFLLKVRDFPADDCFAKQTTTGQLPYFCMESLQDSAGKKTSVWRVCSLPLWCFLMHWCFAYWNNQTQLEPLEENIPPIQRLLVEISGGHHRSTTGPSFSIWSYRAVVKVWPRRARQVWREEGIVHQSCWI